MRCHFCGHFGKLFRVLFAIHAKHLEGSPIVYRGKYCRVMYSEILNVNCFHPILFLSSSFMGPLNGNVLTEKYCQSLALPNYRDKIRFAGLGYSRYSPNSKKQIM